MRLTVNFPLSGRIAFCKAVAPLVVRLPGVSNASLNAWATTYRFFSGCQLLEIKNDKKDSCLRNFDFIPYFQGFEKISRGFPNLGKMDEKVPMIGKSR